MDIIDLDFYINVNCDVEFDEIKQWFHKDWEDWNVKWNPSKTSGQTSENRIQFGINEHTEKIDGADNNDWFYFPYYIQVVAKEIPPYSEKELQFQISFIRQMMQRLTDKGCEIKIHAAFEEMI